jgi:hypothetical protein
VVFDAVKQQTYYFAVDSADANMGSVELALIYLSPPPNDDFERRIELSGDPIDVKWFT